MDITIRPYSDQDKDDLEICIQELKNYESQFDPDYLADHQSTINLVDYLLKKDKIFVATASNQIVGVIALEEQLKEDALLFRPVKTIYISDIVVLPTFRKQGIGEKLIKQVEEYAKSKGIGYLKLATFSQNEVARKLYLKTGFNDFETIMLRRLT